MKMLIGVIFGALAAWLYSPQAAREQLRERFTGAPESLQQLQYSAASLTASGAQRVAEAVDSAPVSGRVKDVASGAAFNVWAAADQLGHPTTTDTEVSQDGEAAARA